MMDGAQVGETGVTLHKFQDMKLFNRGLMVDYCGSQVYNPRRWLCALCSTHIPLLYNVSKSIGSDRINANDTLQSPTSRAS